MAEAIVPPYMLEAIMRSKAVAPQDRAAAARSMKRRPYCAGCLRRPAVISVRHRGGLLLPACSKQCAARFCVIMLPSIAAKRKKEADDISSSEDPSSETEEQQEDEDEDESSSAVGSQQQQQKKKSREDDLCPWLSEYQIEYRHFIGEGRDAVLFPCRLVPAVPLTPPPGAGGDGNTAPPLLRNPLEGWDSLVIRFSEGHPDFFGYESTRILAWLSSGPFRTQLGNISQNIASPHHWGICKVNRKLANEAKATISRPRFALNAENKPLWPPRLGDLLMVQIYPRYVGNLIEWQVARNQYLTRGAMKYHNLDGRAALLSVRCAVFTQIAAVICSLHTLLGLHHRDTALRNILYRPMAAGEPNNRVYHWQTENLALETTIPYLFVLSDFDMAHLDPQPEGCTNLDILLFCLLGELELQAFVFPSLSRVVLPQDLSELDWSGVDFRDSWIRENVWEKTPNGKTPLTPTQPREGDPSMFMRWLFSGRPGVLGAVRMAGDAFRSVPIVNGYPDHGGVICRLPTQRYDFDG
jgi:hypothetical protein